ncbi:cytochrome b-c1 complex subunit 7-like [Oratosquilla oratoria]|uniref:cytochrome b-c1 complex subunit 7-like n=1 Tax=Oratosquilla oratoria TaxID=337810 RepID=UPI003F77010D
MAGKKVAGGFADSLKRWAFRITGYNQVGLYHDDILYENPDVQTAIQRLPSVVQDERMFRIQRALHLSMTKTILPKEQWVSYEEDRAKGRYLQQYLQEVINERKEKEEWNKM